jgi:hypothetical protein
MHAIAIANVTFGTDDMKYMPPPKKNDIKAPAARNFIKAATRSLICSSPIVYHQPGPLGNWEKPPEFPIALPPAVPSAFALAPNVVLAGV